jgi:Rieske Fe-S protein
MSTDMESQNQGEQPDRRGFIKGASCAIGAAIGVVPMAAGVRMALDPLSRKAIAVDAEFVRLAEVSDLEVGVPRKYAIVEDKRDKWSRYKDVPVGAVYLLLEKAEDSKSSEPKVIAYNTVCPHLGCFVDYRPKQQDYFCPCHDSNFALDGTLKKGVSPRGMDSLEVELRNGSEVWVKFQRFKANASEKIAIG